MHLGCYGNLANRFNRRSAKGRLLIEVHRWRMSHQACLCAKTGSGPRFVLIYHFARLQLWFATKMCILHVGLFDLPANVFLVV